MNLSKSVFLLLAYALGCIDCPVPHKQKDSCDRRDLCWSTRQNHKLPCWIAQAPQSSSLETPGFAEVVSPEEGTREKTLGSCLANETECHEEHNLLSLEEYSGRNRKCASVINRCWRPMLNIPFINGESEDYKTLISDMHQVCRYYRLSEACVEASISDCEQTSLEKNIEAGLYVGDFLCNDEGIALLQDYNMRSTCRLEKRWFYTFKSWTQFCSEIHSLQSTHSRRLNVPSSTRCGQARTVFQCVKNLLYCGDAAGVILWEVFTGLMLAASPRECTYQGSNELLERFLDFCIKIARADALQN